MEEKFSADLLHGLAADVVRAMQQNEAQQKARPKASLHTRFNSRKIDLLDIKGSLKGDIQVVFLVEDINLTWMKAIGKNLNIEPSFFAGHAREIENRNDWATIMGTAPTQTIQEAREQLYSFIQTTDQARFWHLDGITTSEAECKRRVNCQPRRATWTKQYGWHDATRISFWSSHQICLILVDAPASEAPVNLHLPVSRNRAGLIVPQLYGQCHSLYECLHRFLSHGWHFNILFSEHSLSARTFGYILATSTWRTNLREIDIVAKHIGFEEIRKPTVAINDKLHDLRRDLDRLHKEVSRTLEWIPATVQQELSHIRKLSTEYVMMLDGSLEQILVESSVLEKFMMDSFTLLLSSISVREAETSAKMSRQAQQLTALAFIYVPLSFVTGIFGMNIKEINGSLTPGWAPVVALAVTLILTASTFAVFYIWQRKKKVQMT